MKLHVVWLLRIGWILLAGSNLGSAQDLKARWVAIDPKAEPGTPIRMEVLKSSREATTVRIATAGFWLSTESYNGRTFSTITFPEPQLSGLGFPQEEGDRGWYDFPAETQHPPLPSASYQRGLTIATPKPLFPEKALGQKFSSVEEMERLGVDPAGARPGIPALRGYLSVSRANGRGDLSASTIERTFSDLKLEAPLRPAGYEGSDQAKPDDTTTQPDERNIGYAPPQLVDDVFYRSFKGEYRGTEDPLTPISGAGAFSATEFRVPLVEVLDPLALRVIATAVLEIKHLKGTEDFDCPLSWDNWIFKLPFINGEAIREALTAKGLKIEASRSAHYLIVTPREYRDELNTFALWKQSKGLNVDFAYVGNAAGDDVAPDRAALDAYLEAYFRKNYCHGVYALLVGDTDVIPTGRSTRIVTNPDAADGDSDHVYEVLGSDRFASLYVGRLSVNSAGELTDQLAKILSYERDPVAGDWPLQATLAANSENDDGSNGVSASHPSKYAAAVNAIATYGSYDSPPTFQRLHAGAANNATPRAVNQDVTDAIDAGRGHVLYRGHGGGSSWVAGWDGSSNSGDSWTATDIAGLNNRAFPIVYSIACQNGRIRNNESIAESWMSRAGAGAVAHWGASVNSYTSENHERAKGIFRALYESGFSRLAPALAEAERISHAATGGGSSWDNNTFCYLLLGDPELTVRKRRVFADLNLSLIISNLSAGRLFVQVLDTKGEAQPGAFVNVTLNSGRTLNGFAGPDGQITFGNLALTDVARVDSQVDGFKPGSVTPKPTEPPATRRWLAFDDNAKPGTPGTVNVVRSTREGTSFGVRLPGVWLTTEQYAGRAFTRIELPEVQLGGTGFPQKEGDRGWYDFPADSGYPALDPERYRNALAISIAKALFPEKAVGQNPQSAAEMARLGIDPAGARPGVPTLRGFIGVARDSGPNDLNVEVVPEGRRQLALEAPLMPAGFEGSDQAKPDDTQVKPDDQNTGYLPPQLVDEEFYKSFKGDYRGIESPVSDISQAGVFSAAEIRIPLVTVLDPSTIEIFTTVLVNIKHLKGTEDFDCPLSWDNWIFKLPFINGEAIREALTAKGLRIEASRSAHYLIVTPREYRDELNAFALWKQSKGLNVDFAYVGNAAGDDVAPDRAALDAYLEAYFKKNYCHGVYVLLVGDTDVIPTGRSTRVVASPDAADGDSDHVYEVLGSDRFASLYVGRLSVNSAGELTDQLAKILSYERDPVAGDWPLQATLAANSENDDGSNGVSASHPSKYAGAVNAIATYGSYDSPPTFQRLHAGAANNATPRAVNQDVTDAIDAGRGHVLYRGHGGGSSWVSGWDGSSNSGDSWTATDIAGLNNRAFPIVYSIACQNGRIRNNESIAESWMSRAGAGAVAHWGASVNSYTSENHERAKGIFRALYEGGFSRLAPALAEAERISHAATGGGSSWDNNTFCYLLLGDPELTVRKRRVFADLNLSLIISNLSAGRLFVQVLDTKGEAQPGAFVNVTLNSGRTLNGFAGPDGQITFGNLALTDVARVDSLVDGFKPGSVTPKPTEPPATRRWLAFDDNAKPGTPGTVNVVRSTREGTSFGVRLPGVWLATEQYAGRAFTRIELPDVQLGGTGFPQKEGDRGWYDFPADSGYPALDPERYRNALAISIAKALFPEKAVGQNPQSAAEMARLGIDPAGARPGVPTLRGFIGVARDSGPNDLNVEVVPEGRRQLALEAPLMPAGFEGSDQAKPDDTQVKPDDQNTGYLPPQLVDEEFYKSFKGDYRGIESPVSDISQAGVFSAAEIRIPLVTVLDPSTIEIFTTVLVNIKHLKGTEDFDCPLSWDNWIFKLPFINGEAIREALTAKGLKIEASRSAHYLIVTPREYRDELNTFALWKQSKGLNVDFAYVGNAAGDDVAPDRAALDAYLEAYFKKNYCHGVYVLLVGDTDVIPTGRSTRVVASPDAADGDSDHVYEVLGSDRFASLYVGRLSVNSAGELTDQLAKILSYERDPVAGDWPLQATLAANSENDDGSNGVSASHPSKYAGAVNAIATYGSYDSPPTFQRLHAGAANNATPRAVNQDVTDAIDAGRGHVLYRGHGGGSSWVSGWDGSSNSGDSWTATDIAGLNNRAFPIVYSIACQNGRIRNNESIAESWMSRAGAGAVAHWGASVNSYTSENHERAKGIFRALYESGFSRLAPALAEAERISHAATGGGGSWDNNTFCYLLLGDPELTVRKRRVFADLNLSLIISNLSAGRLFVQVLDTKGEAQPGAFVNVTLNSGRTLNGFAGPDGQITFGNLALTDVARVDSQVDGFKPGSVTPKPTEPPATRRWLAFDDNAKPGTPGTVNVVRSTREGTSFGVRLPGVWLTTEQYAGRAFTRIELPEVQLGGTGFPQKEGDRGWYDFPADSGYPALDPERYRNALAISIAKALFPEKAVGQNPQSAAEMARLGIDPAGARPGVPTLRGFIGVARDSGPNDLNVEIVPEGRRQLALEAPLMPAGFEGSDQAKPETQTTKTPATSHPNSSTKSFINPSRAITAASKAPSATSAKPVSSPPLKSASPS
jgi:hypothetical protein